MEPGDASGSSEGKEDAIAVGGGGDRPTQAASAAPEFASIHLRLRCVLAARDATLADARAASAALSAAVSWQSANDGQAPIVCEWNYLCTMMCLTAIKAWARILLAHQALLPAKR